MSQRPDLLDYTEEDRRRILKHYNRTPKSLKSDIEHLQKWLREQDHLPQDIFTEQKIEKFLLLNKFSIEKTKVKLENYFTIRKCIPEIYKDKEPYQECMRELRKEFYWLPLRELTKDLYRPIIFCIVASKPERFDPFCFFAHTYSIAEVRLDYDYMLGEISIFDFKNMSVKLLTKVTPMVIKKASIILEKVFASRVQGIHYINCPFAIDTFIKLIKTFLKPKLASRIHVHKNVDSLHKYVPQELLPLEYGGKQESIHIIQDKWNVVLEEYKPWFDKLKTIEVDESSKPSLATNDEFLGFHGSFRKLDLD